MERSTLSYSLMGHHVPTMCVSDKGKAVLKEPEKVPSQQAFWGHQNAHTTEQCLNSFVLRCPDLGQSSMYGHDDAHLLMKSSEHVCSHRAGQKEIKLGRGCAQPFSRNPHPPFPSLSQKQKGLIEPLSFLLSNNQEEGLDVPLLPMLGPSHQVGLANPLRPLPSLDQGAGFVLPPYIAKPFAHEVGNSHDRSRPPKHHRRTSWGTCRKSVGNKAPRFNAAAVADFINHLRQIAGTTGHTSNNSGVEDGHVMKNDAMKTEQECEELDLSLSLKF